ncbi:MAG: hypothetical protein NTY94_09080 [Alphaproteobacteria bacterium]|nr:hypothetical protein [Alphaproteobacteria bacterium]
MYSDSELDAAVAEGAISADSAAALRAFVARHRATLPADEEQFRLLTGFNDIFVSIAMVLLLVALGWLASQTSPLAGAAALVAASWGLAEFFTRRRRMALPSILLLGSFAGGLFFCGLVLAKIVLDAVAPAAGETMGTSGGAAIAVLGTWLHWRRFRVPITVAAGAIAAVAAVLAALVALVPALGDRWLVLLFAAGLALFGLAMRWDMSDPARTTRRADVAFWLHLAAAPLIVHPVFALLGLLDGKADIARAALAIGLYVLLAAVALVVDRRALLVSSLAYVLYAISTLVQAAGAVDAGFALTALVVGSGLLLLSAFWRVARHAVLRAMPQGVRARMPAA